jgi:cytochrome P450
MNEAANGFQVLEEGSDPPAGAVLPPRQPRWWDTFAFMADPDRFCRENLRRWGPIFRTGVFGGTTVFLAEPEAVRMAFNGDNLYTQVSLFATTNDMFGEFSLFQRPDLHRARKAALTPAFTGSMLAGYVPRMHRVVAHHLAGWGAPLEIALTPAVEALSFDLLVPLLLGVPIDAGEETLAGLPITTKAELRRLYRTFFDGFFGLIRQEGPFTAYGRGMTARRRLMAFMQAVIERRRGQSFPELPEDFLGLMLHGQRADPEGLFTDALMANQCLLQLWGAHYEITGLLASWMVQIARHPQVRQRLEQELAAAIDGPVAALSLEDLRRLPYLDATLNETLRTLPPSSTVTRRLTRPVVFNGLLLRQGWGLIAEPRLVHAWERLYPDPDRFDPERFLGRSAEDRRHAFIPFGGGVHACLGAQLAMTIARVFAIHALRACRWQGLGEPRFDQFPLRMLRPGFRLQLAEPAPDGATAGVG